MKIGYLELLNLHLSKTKTAGDVEGCEALVRAYDALMDVSPEKLLRRGKEQSQ